MATTLAPRPAGDHGAEWSRAGAPGGVALQPAHRFPAGRSVISRLPQSPRAGRPHMSKGMDRRKESKKPSKKQKEKEAKRLASQQPVSRPFTPPPLVKPPPTER